MSAFPFPPELGAHLTALTIQALAYNQATGALTTSGSAVVLRAKLDTLSDDLQTQTEDIHAHGAAKANNVPILDDAQFSMTIFLDQTGTDYNKLRQLWASNSYFRISYTAGYGSAAKVETLDVSRVSLSSPRQGDGAQKVTATFAQIDSGTDFRTRANPA
jgi:hypothetical protein